MRRMPLSRGALAGQTHGDTRAWFTPGWDSSTEVKPPRRWHDRSGRTLLEREPGGCWWDARNRMQSHEFFGVWQVLIRGKPIHMRYVTVVLSMPDMPEAVTVLVSLAVTYLTFKGVFMHRFDLSAAKPRRVGIASTILQHNSRFRFRVLIMAALEKLWIQLHQPLQIPISLTRSRTLTTEQPLNAATMLRVRTMRTLPKG